MNFDFRRPQLRSSSIFKMLNTSRIVILTSIVLVNVSIPVDTKIVHPLWLKEDDINSLSTVEPKEALPIIFIENDENKVLRYPMCLAQVEIENGRLVSGTEFYRIPNSKKEQIFFCPHPNKKKNCLHPMQFKNAAILQCEAEPKPILRPHPTADVKCGRGGKGTSLAFVYKICKAKWPYTYSTTGSMIYTICFDKFSNRTLHVAYGAVSVNLFSEKALIKEQQIQFQQLSEDTNGIIKHIFLKKLKSQAKSKPKYKFQKLLWPEYMPFAMWRKTTYHYINVALQHEALFDLWNEINGYIKTNAIESPDSPRLIFTGVVYIPKAKIPTNKDNNQIYNYWYTAVIDKNSNPYKGLIILMNNFIEEEISDQHYIDEKEICEQNLCVDLNVRFAGIGGQVRCCKITYSNSLLFYKEETASNLKVEEILEIRNLTSQDSK